MDTGGDSEEEGSREIGGEWNDSVGRKLGVKKNKNVKKK